MFSIKKSLYYTNSKLFIPLFRKKWSKKTLQKPYKNPTKTLQKPYKNLTKTLQKPYKNLTKTLQKSLQKPKRFCTTFLKSCFAPLFFKKWIAVVLISLNSEYISWFYPDFLYSFV
jgi:hypothetical protein